MNVGFSTVLYNIVAMILLAIPGFIIEKAKIKNFSSGVVFLLLYICQPLVTFVSLQNLTYSKDILFNLLYSAIFSFFGLGILFVFSYFLFSKLKLPKAEIYKYGSVFSNCSFIGIPLINALFQSTNPEIVVYALVFITIFNIYSWTAGVFAMSGKKEYISVKKALLNPPTIAFFVALPFFILQIDVGSYSLLTNRLMYSLAATANMITPLSMILIGINLAKANIFKIFKSKGVYIASFIKLIIAPLVMFLIMLPFDLHITVVAALVFCMAMPTAATTVIFAEKFNEDAQEASSLVLVSTLLCLITVPIMFLLIG